MSVTKATVLDYAISDSAAIMKRAPTMGVEALTHGGISSMPRYCSIPDCTKVVRARGWCSAHYTRWQRHGDPIAGGPSHGRTKADRFWSSKVEFTGRCWFWLGRRDRYGYGNFRNGSRVVKAHRFSYEFCIGPIPEGLVLDHLCRTPSCVRPDHLEPVTNRVNVLRGNGITAREAARTHCPQGHPYDGANTYIRLNGKRECRACRRK